MIVIVPMAGRGSRFAGSYIGRPKPLVEVDGEWMVFLALRSLDGISFRKIVFVVLEEHEASFSVSSAVRTHFGNQALVVTIPEVTEGQLCTVLAAREYLNSDEDVLITSADTYVVSGLGRDIVNKKPNCKGIISVAKLAGDRWSFARTDVDGRVLEVAEKVRISDHASTGLYYFSHGSDLVNYGEEMIRKGEKTRGEYYVIPVYQKFIEQGLRVDISPASEMWDMGTPEALEEYQRHLKQTKG